MNVMGILFTNDANIGDLTNKRTMASLPFGGRYRQVDFGLSNFAYAGIRHVGIIARFSYQSLMNHIGDGEEWGLEPVSYTHLDVYKRQSSTRFAWGTMISPMPSPLITPMVTVSF